MSTAKTEPFKLPILGEDVVDIEAELRKLDDEAGRVAAPQQSATHWVDQMVNPQFTKSQRAGTTLLVSGLTAAHDYLVKAALTGLGYNVEVIETPTNDALRYGKEFGNRGQCNPTYFTVGNLVKFLTERAARDGIPPRRSSTSTCSSRRAPAAPAASACTRRSTVRPCATAASTASASCSSSRRAACSRPRARRPGWP